MKKNVILAIGISVIAVSSGDGALVGELGVLDVSGTNPVTSLPWAEGDQYRLMFVSSTTVRDVTSTVITDYNAALTTFANNAGLDGNWTVVGSTAAVNARVNTSTTGNGGVGIFALDGISKIADNYADLWDGSLDNVILTEAGTAPGNYNVAVGTFATGQTDTDRPLGDIDASDLNRIQAGVTNNTSFRWARVWNVDGTQNQYFYAMSDILTVQNVVAVPEPSAVGLVGFAGIAFLLRRRR